VFVDSLIFHPSGGGQPDDLGVVSIGERSIPVKLLIKTKAGVCIVLADNGDFAQSLSMGDSVVCELDWKRRYLLMRLHTGAHLSMAAIRRTVPGYSPAGMQISHDLSTAYIRFRSPEVPSNDQLHEASCMAAAWITQSRAVSAHILTSFDEARRFGGSLFRVDPELKLTGSVRVVAIDGVDVNPCGGTHVANTNEVRGLAFKHMNSGSSGLYELRYDLAA